MTKFLESKYAQILSEQPGHQHAKYLASILKCLQASNEFFQTLYRAPLWLRDCDRNKTIEALDNLLAGFKEAANYNFRVLKLCRFKFQPKFHMLAEIRFELVSERLKSERAGKSAGKTSSFNPITYSTQMDEDFIGKISQMSRFVASRTVHRKTMERYKLAVASVW